MMLLLVLLAATAFATHDVTITGAMQRHDFDPPADCAQIKELGRCGEMVAMNKILDGDNHCEAVCGMTENQASTHACSLFYKDSNDCSETVEVVRLPWDNTCYEHPELKMQTPMGELSMWINMMQNFLCMSQASCEAATAGTSMMGCVVGPDKNGDEVGTHIGEQCVSHATENMSWKHTMCSMDLNTGAAANRHDYMESDCAQIETLGHCALMRSMNNELGGDDMCTDECGEGAGATQACSNFYPMSGACQGFSMLITMPFDNSCALHQPMGKWINMMQNFICGTQDQCENATAGNGFTGCMVGPDANGNIAIGTSVATCVARPKPDGSGFVSWKSTPCPADRRKL